MLGTECEVKVQTYPSILGTLSLSMVPLLSGVSLGNNLSLEGEEVEKDDSQGKQKVFGRTLLMFLWDGSMYKLTLQWQTAGRVSVVSCVLSTCNTEAKNRYIVIIM